MFGLFWWSMVVVNRFGEPLVVFVTVLRAYSEASAHRFDLIMIAHPVHQIQRGRISDGIRQVIETTYGLGNS